MKLEDVRLPFPKTKINEGSFDIEKWRQENPMDYITSARLLTLSHDPTVINEVFWTIYQVAQLHVPDTLYKYSSLTDDTGLNERKLDTLLQKKMYLAKVKDLNDPFDCKAFYYDAVALTKYERLKPYEGRIIDDFSAMQRVASLTANGPQSMPMWAHYANNHTGFCVAYDMNEKENLAFKSCTFPVQYTDQRIDITGLMDSFANLMVREIETQQASGNKEIVIDDLSLIYISQLLCNLKHDSWAYEKEYRCTEASQAAGIPFIEAKAKEIYVGISCGEENRNRLHLIGDSLGIPVHQMEFEEVSEKFQLLEK